MLQNQRDMSQLLPGAAAEVLDATISRVVYQSLESGYVVLRVAANGEEVTAVGEMSAPMPGEKVRLRGRWEVHAKYGRQFRFEDYELLRSATAEGLAAYLADALPGVGPELARRIIEHFGERTFEALDEGEETLRQVRGIGPVKAATIADAWAEHRHVHELMAVLRSKGLSPSLARRVSKLYGPRAIEVIERRPYRLAMDVRGVGFLTADRIARKAGLSEDDPERFQAALVHVLREAVGEGHMYLEREALVQSAAKLVGHSPGLVEEQLRRLAEEKTVAVERSGGGEEAIYLPGLLSCEKRVAWLLRSLAATRATRAPDLRQAQHLLAHFEAFAGVELNDEQRAAVLATTRQPVTVVTGGPGTGKTTLTRAVVWVWTRSGRSVALAAPTGRAAKRLEEVADHEASTIHRLLKYQPGGGFAHGPTDPLPYDLVIVDESSMVDMTLAWSLLEALKPGTTLLLVGDADQLPPVGPGAFFAEIVGSQAVPVTRLTKIYRQAERSLIVRNAHALLRGEGMLLPTRERWRGEDMLWVDVEAEQRREAEKAARAGLSPATVADQYEIAFAKLANAVTRSLPRAGFQPEEVQVLSPMRRGPLGVDSLNARLQELLNPPGPRRPEVRRGQTIFRLGDRVLQTANNYDKGVFNGEIGHIAHIGPDGCTTVAFAIGEIEYQPDELGELELAYALTVHKSQGSEYPAVVMLVHSSHYIMLRRNLLYTALTRAQGMAILIGDRKGLWKAIRTAPERERLTRLAARLRGEAPIEPDEAPPLIYDEV
ncbi:MAG: ATP-dependent RecD-like DNA helicase [Armatimonadetes bacterium]|nr:ATP-dependent RecD-like DNA helicase [Armatimonadota bacterium]